MEYADKVLLKRRSGRIFEVTVVDAAGEAMCNLPCTCVKFEQRARERGEWCLGLVGTRVQLIDVDEAPTEPMEVVPR